MGVTVLQGQPAGVREVELPSYLSHKVVRAAKILTISVRTEDGTYRLALDGPAYVDVTKLWVTQRQPSPGGYFVQYEDGYSSYSPAPQFEAGYTAVEPAATAEAEPAPPAKVVLAVGDFVQLGKEGVPPFAEAKPIILIDTSNDLVFVEGGDDSGYASEWLVKVDKT